MMNKMKECRSKNQNKRKQTINKDKISNIKKEKRMIIKMLKISKTIKVINASRLKKA